MKRVAIPVTQGKLSEYFGGCNHYEIFEIDGGNLARSEIKVPPQRDITELPEWAVHQEITDIITHKVDNRILTLFTAKKINLFVGIAVDTPLILIEDYMSGKLQSDEKIINEIKLKS